MQEELFEPPDPDDDAPADEAPGGGDVLGPAGVEVDAGPVEAVETTTADIVTSLTLSPDRLLPGTVCDALDELDALRTLRATAEARQFAIVANLAATAPRSDQRPLPDQKPLPGREALVDLGGDGSPPVPEFIVVEIAALLHTSHTAARGLVADALSARWRHPRMWAAVMAGRLPVWQARKIAQAVRWAGLDRARALRIDRALAPGLGTLSWPRLEALLEGEIVNADPVAADQREERARAGRYARVVREEAGQAGIRTLIARLATPEAEQLDATIAQLAHSLHLGGDTDALDVRRSRALGILAVPDRALALLAGDTATGNRHKPPVRLYVHVNADRLGPAGVARLEGNGAVPVTSLRALLADSTVRVTTVIDHRDSEPIDAYEIPDRMREQVVLAHPYEIFPWGTRRARHTDLDHTIPWHHGGPTSPTNLGPLGRTGHRAKTHAGWRCRQTAPGHWLWRSPYGRDYEVDNWGTRVWVPPEAIPSPTELEALERFTGPPALPPSPPRWERQRSRHRRARESGSARRAKHPGRHQARTRKTAAMSSVPSPWSSARSYSPRTASRIGKAPASPVAASASSRSLCSPRSWKLAGW